MPEVLMNGHGVGNGTVAAGPILVVEDDPDICDVVRQVLQDAGWHVEGVADGLEAVRWASRRRPRLVILDLMLPGADGLAVADVLQARYGEALPIIVMSAHHRLMERAARAKAFAYLPKPFDLDDLLALVERALGGPPLPEDLAPGAG